MKLKIKMLCIFLSLTFVFTLFAVACKEKSTDKNNTNSNNSVSSSDNTDSSSDSSDVSTDSTDSSDNVFSDNSSGNKNNSTVSGGSSSGSSKPSNSTGTGNSSSNGSSNGSSTDNNGDASDDVEVSYTPVNPKTGTEVSGNNRDITVSTSDVAYTKFFSFGANMTAGILTDEGRKATGFNDSYFEIERARYLAAKPQYCRFLFPIDYMITDTEENPKRTDWQNDKDYINFKNGVYDFDGEKMQAVYKYLDVLKECGSKVYINFGWGTAERIQNWFLIRDDMGKGSATAHTDLTAKACAALLKHLIKDKGYTNIIGVTFGNEPNSNTSYIGVGSKETYYASIIKKMYNEIKPLGLKNFAFTGAETSNIRQNNHSWMAALQSKIGNILTGYTAHNYYSTIKQASAGVTEVVDYNMLYDLGGFLYGTYSENGNKTIVFSEMNTGNYDYYDMSKVQTAEGGEWTWNTSNASYFIGCANSGIAGACRWSYSGQYWTDPVGYGSVKNNYQSLWLCPLSADTVENGVLDKFYEDSLLTNYVPYGSQVLKVNWTGTDTRVAAFKLPDGNYTVIVEVNDGNSSRNININFDKAINKTFYKMSFSHDVVNEANAIVPACEKTFSNVGKKLSDSVNSKYSYYIYTTRKPIKQIKLNKVTATVEAGVAHQITASLIDADSSEKINWSISAAVDKDGKNITRKGSISNGKYTVASNAKEGDIIAVRAELKSDPKVCAVALITVK